MQIIFWGACVSLALALALALTLAVAVALVAAPVLRRERITAGAPLEFTFKAKTSKAFPDGSLKLRLIRNFRQTGQETKPQLDNVAKHLSAEFFTPTGSVSFPAPGAP